ncbi:hypothetical protein AAFF_G00412230 [Aldrovandia affinis]|uniref:Uncharacterized protein n=1 Tax=Aldrovandia affinis TaxID=143900 RepID=A0AAD7SBE1_9TELE|nr:hypothetical protein AAFF_G00412230 [Aldrovandia affinis]
MLAVSSVPPTGEPEKRKIKNKEGGVEVSKQEIGQEDQAEYAKPGSSRAYSTQCCLGSCFPPQAFEMENGKFHVIHVEYFYCIALQQQFREETVDDASHCGWLEAIAAFSTSDSPYAVA